MSPFFGFRQRDPAVPFHKTYKGNGTEDESRNFRKILKHILEEIFEIRFEKHSIKENSKSQPSEPDEIILTESNTESYQDSRPSVFVIEGE